MELTIDDMLLKECHEYNQATGNIAGFSCELCKNRGWFAIIEDGYLMRKECECMAKRRSLKRIERSGLSKQIKKCTFDSFVSTEHWQRINKEKALRYVSERDGSWFFIGGQVGSGKTHLCTAIVGELLRLGLEAKYMLWRDEIIPLKKEIMADYYENEIRKYKSVKVLYIDDFLKTEKGKNPSPADVNIAFEILNYRYNDPKLITIISSERTIDELLEIDEAVGSRIYQRTTEYCSNINQDRSKNYRLKN